MARLGSGRLFVRYMLGKEAFAPWMPRIETLRPELVSVCEAPGLYDHSRGTDRQMHHVLDMGASSDHVDCHAV